MRADAIRVLWAVMKPEFQALLGRCAGIRERHARPWEDFTADERTRIEKCIDRMAAGMAEGVDHVA